MVKLIEDLPPELIQRIGSFLSFQEATKLKVLNKKFDRIFNRDALKKTFETPMLFTFNSKEFASFDLQKLIREPNFFRRHFGDPDLLQIVGTYKGLIMFYKNDYIRDRLGFFIYNLTTREHLILPRLGAEIVPQIWAFSSSFEEGSPLLMTSDLKKTFIFDWNDDSWKTIDAVPPPSASDIFQSHTRGVYTRGLIYWINERKGKIISFDTRSLLYREEDFSVVFKDDEMGHTTRFFLGVSKEGYLIAGGLEFDGSDFGIYTIHCKMDSWFEIYNFHPTRFLGLGQLFGLALGRIFIDGPGHLLYTDLESITTWYSKEGNESEDDEERNESEDDEERNESEDDEERSWYEEEREEGYWCYDGIIYTRSASRISELIPTKVQPVAAPPAPAPASKGPTA